MSLQSVFIQIVRLQIRRCNQNDAATKKAIEKSTENHRVANVADEKFVKAQYLGFRCDTFCDRVQWVFDIIQAPQSIMYVVHHAVKMDALFLLDVQAFKEQIH